MSQDDPISQFSAERAADIASMGADEELRAKSIEWMLHADKYKYTYNFSWMGRPIIKYPNDMVVQQELMWNLKPDLVIETGIAHGGSIIFTASMMEMMGLEGEVVGIDIDIRQHNRTEIENHPMMKRITMIEGSSTDLGVFEQVKAKAAGKRCVMVVLDSLHSHEHVYNELQLYPDLVTTGSYLLLPDTFIELFPNVEVEIYNRWGEMLFRSVGYTTPWDGRYSGGPVPVGTYYYIIKLNDPEYPDAYTGPLTVIR